MDGWMGWRADGWTGGWDGWMAGWMDGRRTDGRTDRQTEIDVSHYGNSYNQFVCRRYTELIRPVPEDATAEVS